MVAEESLQPITLKLITPVWTGGVNGEVDRVHASGIMGSLRWWYEVLVRGMGGKACDPSEHQCIYDPDKPDGGLCHACRVFGATGWSRRFRLIVDDKTTPDLSFPPRIVGKPYVVQRDQKREERTPRWFFGNPPRKGSLSLDIISAGPFYDPRQGHLTPDRFFQPEIIYGLIEFMEQWGSIGARPQMGFGLFQITSEKKGYTQLLVELKRQQPITIAAWNPMLPALSTMFFTCIPVGSMSVKETFDFKSELRRQFSYDAKVTDSRDKRIRNTALRHFVMGTVKGDNQGAKIMMSQPLPNQTIRIWGWVPETMTFSGKKFTRDEVVQKIYTYLGSKRIYWREFDSPRDKIRKNDPYEFLESLLKGEKK